MGRFDINRLLNDLGIDEPGGEEDAASSPTDAQTADAAPTPPDQDEDAPPTPPQQLNSPESTPSSDPAADMFIELDEVSAAAEAVASEFETDSDSTPDATTLPDSTEEPPTSGFISSQGLELNEDTICELPLEAEPPSESDSSDEADAIDDRGAFVSAPPRDAEDQMDPVDELTPLWSPDPGDQPAGANSAGHGDLGELLVSRGIITADRLDTARGLARQTPGKSLPAILVEMGEDEEPIQRLVAEINDLPFERIDADDGFHVKMMETLGVDFCRANKVLPLRKEDRWVVLGMASPDDVFLLDEIRRRLGGSPIKTVLVTGSDVTLVCEIQSEEELADPGLDDLLAEVAEDDVEVVDEDDDDVDFERQAGESPVIRYVNYIIQSALKEGASDIHIEPGENKLKIRFRIDGILFERMNPLAKMHAAIISRLKIMANLDISERRIPQDGRIRAVVGGRKLDLRVSTLPTVAGEKCVIRILDSRSISVGLNQLGFSDDTLTIWQHQVKQPHGIILVTGPTGSGKTTTLYSSLREMDTSKMNVSTVEDPVEYHMANITQVQIHDKIGFSFASALRSLLRQDPDVVMVGEIRDADTARIAVQAALTGHLVLSTLHTNDAPSSVTRLINIGVEPFLIGSALNAVLAQRLVRRVCEACKKPQELDDEMQEFVAMTGQQNATICVGEGCDRCRQTGYVGRLGIYELLVLDDVTRDFVARNPNVTEFRRMCLERGMISLRQDGMLKVANGSTTVEEVLRVTESTI